MPILKFTFYLNTVFKTNKLFKVKLQKSVNSIFEGGPVPVEAK